jgi:SM-20-related protein
MEAPLRAFTSRTSPSSAIAAAVAHEGMSVWLGFLNASQVGVIAGQCRRQQTADDSAFHWASIGRASGRVIDDAVRQDHTWGLEGKTGSKAVRRYLARLSTLRRALNRSPFLGLHDWEGHFAFYPPGVFYQRHLDRFRSDERRFVSTVLYLNEDWQTAMGVRFACICRPGR